MTRTPTTGTKAAAVAALLLAVAGAGEAASLPGSERAAEAITLCLSVESAPRAEKAALIARGLARAEEALAADETDARAHFAAFCNLARQLELSPLSLGTLRTIGRLKKLIDRTLELAPDSADALTAKGAFLAQLPRLLGGDVAEGERLLRRALDVDPGYEYARATLTRLFGAQS